MSQSYFVHFIANFFSVTIFLKIILNLCHVRCSLANQGENEQTLEASGGKKGLATQWAFTFSAH